MKIIKLLYFEQHFSNFNFLMTNITQKKKDLIRKII